MFRTTEERQRIREEKRANKEALRREIKAYYAEKAKEQGIVRNKYGFRKWSNYPLMQRISLIVSIISLIVALIARTL